MQFLKVKVHAMVFCCALMLFGSHFVIPQSGKAYQTFAFRKFEAMVNSPYQMIHVSQDNAQFVRSHIQKELESHGLILASSPELYVDIFVNLKIERQATGGHAMASTSGGGTTGRGVSIYEVGTLTVKLNGKANNNLLWQDSRTYSFMEKEGEKDSKTSR